MKSNKPFFCKPANMAVLLIIFLLSSLIVSCSAQSTIFAPTWLKKGAYAEYTFGSGHVQIPERSVIIINNTEIVKNSTFKQFDSGAYRWECVDLTEDTAKLRITLSVVIENATVPWVADVNVNTLSRAVYLENGTLLGTTHLWLPANPGPNDDIVLWDVPPDKVTMRIDDRMEYGFTPQGKQRTFTVAGMGKIGGANAIFTVTCDFDTGVLTDGGLDRHEPTLLSLNVSDVFYQGRFLFADTNIDLGPPYTPLDLRTIFTIIALPVAFVIIFVAVYSRRRRKKH